MLAAILIDMPDSESVTKTVAAVEVLSTAFKPLLKQLSYDLEPAVTLSEPAVFGE